MQAAEPAPIACTLDAGAMGARLADIERLTREHLRFHRLDGLTLYLAYDEKAVDEVRRLVDLERACCAFLKFDLRMQPGGVELSITAPEAAADSARWLFTKFIPEERVGNAQTQAGCGCCGR
jgi:hypothetical protein